MVSFTCLPCDVCEGESGKDQRVGDLYKILTSIPTSIVSTASVSFKSTPCKFAFLLQKCSCINIMQNSHSWSVLQHECSNGQAMQSKSTLVNQMVSLGGPQCRGVSERHHVGAALLHRASEIDQRLEISIRPMNRLKRCVECQTRDGIRQPR